MVWSAVKAALSCSWNLVTSEPRKLPGIFCALAFIFIRARQTDTQDASRISTYDPSPLAWHGVHHQWDCIRNSAIYGRHDRDRKIFEEYQCCCGGRAVQSILRRKVCLIGKGSVIYVRYELDILTASLCSADLWIQSRNVYGFLHS